VNKLTTDDPIKLIISNKNDLEDKKITEDEMKVYSNTLSIKLYIII